MSVATPPPFPPVHLDPLSSEQALLAYLQTFQRQSTRNTIQVLRLSSAIAPVDLLSIFQQLQLEQQPHFFGENRSRQEQQLAFGLCRSLRCSGKYRFQLAQTFAQECFRRLQCLTPATSSDIASRIFCSFSFFASDSFSHAFANSLLFLPKFHLQRQGQQTKLLSHIALDCNTYLPSLAEQVYGTLQRLQAIATNPSPLFSPSLDDRGQLYFPSPHEFIKIAQQGLKQVQKKNLEKIVLATAIDLPLSDSLSVTRSLQQLRTAYPDCFIFSLGNGGGDCFIGASPERLLQLTQGQLITDALAGSAPRGQSLHQDHTLGQQLLQNAKEHREHQAVQDYIVQRLKYLGLQPHLTPTRLRQLSNIQHLWTLISAPCPPQITPLELLAHLHPTPAVAGVPTAVACEFIRELEPFERGLYAAPMGWLDADGNSEFWVGIRSALISSQGFARLYAGAGLVAGSDPQKEVAEITLKLQTLWRALW